MSTENVKTVVEKEIGYSYPSSPNAVSFGFDKTGCYHISLEDELGSMTIAAYATREQAKTACDLRPEPYSKYSL